MLSFTCTSDRFSLKKCCNVKTKLLKCGTTVNSQFYKVVFFKGM